MISAGVVVGCFGTGKSALLSKIYRQVVVEGIRIGVVVEFS